MNIAASKKHTQPGKQWDKNLYLNGWVRMTSNGIKPRNFGDDINFSFLPNLTEHKH